MGGGFHGANGGVGFHGATAVLPWATKRHSQAMSSLKTL